MRWLFAALIIWAISISPIVHAQLLMTGSGSNQPGGGGGGGCNGVVNLGAGCALPMLHGAP